MLLIDFPKVQEHFASTELKRCGLFVVAINIRLLRSVARVSASPRHRVPASPRRRVPASPRQYFGVTPRFANRKE
jgi:hypothetical protein